jgi:hypothetical protein
MKKTLQNLNLWMFLLLVTLFISCSKDDNTSPSDLTTQLQTNVIVGTWRVSAYSENGVNKTSSFNGYNFTFTNSAAVSASNGIVTVPGTWLTGVEDSTPKLYLDFFASSGVFEEISEDWRIQSVSSTSISLRHVSGGDGSIDLLTFTKN